MELTDVGAFKAFLAEALEKNGMGELASDGALADGLYRLTVRMLEVNEHMNLTAIKQPRDIIMRHYVDSLSASAYIPRGAHVLDVGCGAGFPCLPLALARPDLHITAVDSTEKKVRYVAETAALLGISPDRFAARALRAEEAGAPGGELREKFNIVVSRAVAALGVLGELCLPCLSTGGMLIALKGDKAAQEIEQAAGLYVLGAGSARLVPTPLTWPDDGQIDRHALVLIEKTAPTPKNFPRKYAQIVKKPL